LIVRSPKTEHYEGKESREIPLFPELVPFLEASWDAAPENSTYIIHRYRSAKQNLRTTFTKIIRRAGLTPWPKLFHNLRGNRAIELTVHFPEHVASAWMGHSTTVARKHYLRVIDADFERASGTIGENDPMIKVAQKAAQSEHARGGKHKNLESTLNRGGLRNSFPCSDLREDTTIASSPSLSQLDPYFVERGTLVIKKLQRSRVIVLHPWNESVDESTSPKPTPNERPNGMKLARHYQALLDTGRFESRAALARYLGVSRARVTQVLKRLSVLPAGGLG
jgi:hypothetical protein